MSKFFITVILLFANLYSQEKFYAISTCTTVDYEGAQICKDMLPNDKGLDIYIVHSQDNKYRTYYGTFNTYQEAKNTQMRLSSKVKAQKPFVQSFDPDEGSFLKIEKYTATLPLKAVDEKPLHEEHIIFDTNNSDVQKFYTLSTCTTVDYEGALICKDLLPKNSGQDIYIVQSKDKKYRTFYGILGSYQEAKNLEKHLSSKVKAQKPFVQTFEAKENSFLKVEKYGSSPISNDVQVTPVIEKPVVLQDEIMKNFIAIKKNMPKEYKELPTKNTALSSSTEKANEIPKNIDISEKSPQTDNTPLTYEELTKYENIMISVDHSTHKMVVEGYKKSGTHVHLREYVVSTGKENLEKPLGVGMITAISFSPTWYPTPKTLSYFKSKGIDLPSAVPAGSKYNYMGSAKISLSHRVNGQEIYRIHGTIHEESIGTSESGGCIRMKNKEVLELANLLQNFTKVAKKSYGNIKVILK